LLICVIEILAMNLVIDEGKDIAFLPSTQRIAAAVSGCCFLIWLQRNFKAVL
jgi:hypothetical protein